MEPYECWSDTMWNSVYSDLGCYVLIVTEHGEIVFLNEAAGRWLNATQMMRKSRSLNDIFPRPVASERAALIVDVLSVGASLVVDGLIRGEGLRNTIRPLPPAPEQKRAALSVFQPLSQIPEGDETSDELPRRRIARHNDLGILARLTSRELQVLMFIARGRSSNEIAEHLHRSRRTIDCHRASIGHKLDLHSRADLALIAVRAGLIRYRGATAGQGTSSESPLFSELVSRIGSCRQSPGHRVPQPAMSH